MNIKVAEGEVLTDDAMSSVDWFVEGVIAVQVKFTLAPQGIGRRVCRYRRDDLGHL
jgi:hypothetical protein